jgi:hypothetical protein
MVRRFRPPAAVAWHPHLGTYRRTIEGMSASSTTALPEAHPGNEPLFIGKLSCPIIPLFMKPDG